MITQESKKSVEGKIQMLLEEFKKYPEKFLTEEDVRAYLYHLLLKDFGDLKDTKDGSKSIPLHTEIRWYGESGKLKSRSDIVILDVSTLKTKDSLSFKLPSKGYSFNFPKIIIEIKLRRRNGSSNKSFKESVKKDRKKLIELGQEFNNNFLSYLIIFDKKNKNCIQTENDNNHKEYYSYSPADDV